jgi:hypothetical protein
MPEPVATVPPCDRCGAIQSTLGALVFSPPTKAGICQKYHVCRTCYLSLFGSTDAGGSDA